MMRYKRTDLQDDISTKLNVLIRLSIEFLLASENKKLNTGYIIKVLKSLEIPPTEIAKMLGKKSVTDISPYLYSKKAPPKRKDR